MATLRVVSFAFLLLVGLGLASAARTLLDYDPRTRHYGYDRPNPRIGYDPGHGDESYDNVYGGSAGRGHGIGGGDGGSGSGYGGRGDRGIGYGSGYGGGAERGVGYGSGGGGGSDSGAERGAGYGSGGGGGYGSGGGAGYGPGGNRGVGYGSGGGNGYGGSGGYGAGKGSGGYGGAGGSGYGNGGAASGSNGGYGGGGAQGGGSGDDSGYDGGYAVKNTIGKENCCRNWEGIYCKCGDGWKCEIKITQGHDAGKTFVNCGDNCICIIEGTVEGAVKLQQLAEESNWEGASCECGEGWSCTISKIEATKSFAKCAQDCSCITMA